MYDAEKIAIHVATNVTVASIIAESGSTVMEYVAVKFPTENQVTASDANATFGP